MPSMGATTVTAAPGGRQDVLDRLRGEGSSVLLVEQDVAVALSHADRGYVLETGRVALAGTGRALMADARVRAAYLGVGAGI
jgi:branched-chain amino acid transport system ATP-binding protein